MKTELHHYLVSLPFSGGYAHAYVICTGKRRDIENVCNKLFATVEEHGYRPSLVPVVFQTRLDSSRSSIREVETFLRKLNPEVGGYLATMTDFHCTAWMTPDSGPDVDWLLKLH